MNLKLIIECPEMMKNFVNLIDTLPYDEFFHPTLVGMPIFYSSLYILYGRLPVEHRQNVGSIIVLRHSNIDKLWVKFPGS